jgi:hypothetical protein
MNVQIYEYDNEKFYKESCVVVCVFVKVNEKFEVFAIQYQVMLIHSNVCRMIKHISFSRLFLPIVKRRISSWTNLLQSQHQTMIYFMVNDISKTQNIRMQASLSKYTHHKISKFLKNQKPSIPTTPFFLPTLLGHHRTLMKQQNTKTSTLDTSEQTNKNSEESTFEEDITAFSKFFQCMIVFEHFFSLNGYLKV